MSIQCTSTPWDTDPDALDTQSKDYQWRYAQGNRCIVCGKPVANDSQWCQSCARHQERDTPRVLAYLMRERVKRLETKIKSPSCKEKQREHLQRVVLWVGDTKVATEAIRLHKESKEKDDE